MHACLLKKRQIMTTTSQTRFANALLAVCRAVLLATAGVTLVACDFSAPLNCADFYAQNPGAPSAYASEGRGLVTHTPSQTTWLQCPAGMSQSAGGSCRGEPLFLNFDDAVAYAQEVSDKSGQTIRLPSVSELRQLNEDACINPAIDVRTFPSMQVENHWTSDESRTTSLLACAVYSYQGNSSCRESKASEYPFMLLIERD
jgi:hypothetical protein